LNILKIVFYLLFRSIISHGTCKGYDRNVIKLEENLIQDLGIDGRIILNGR